MKRCANCGNLAEDEAAYCDVCGRDSFVPAQEDAAAPSVEAAAASEPAPAVETAPAPPAAEAPETAPVDVTPLAAETPPVAETAAEPPARARLNLKPAAGPPEAAEPADEHEREITPEDIAEVKADGWFTIGLIGFPTAGKTWFLNRVKERYSSGLAAYTVSPPKVPQLDEVKGSTVITLHRFALPQHVASKRENKALNSFVILDIPG